MASKMSKKLKLTPTIEHDPVQETQDQEQDRDIIPALNLSPSRSPSPVPQKKKRKSPSKNPARNRKRSASAAELDADGNPKPILRRSAKACQNCRMRKVRCDVMDRQLQNKDGMSQCTNCSEFDKPCIIVESHRRKRSKAPHIPDMQCPQRTGSESGSRRSPQAAVDRTEKGGKQKRGSSINESQHDDDGTHKPHALYQNANTQTKGSKSHLNSGPYAPTNRPEERADDLLTSASIGGDLKRTRLNRFEVPESSNRSMPPRHLLPGFLKPIPPQKTSVDIDYLYAKGALCIPTPEVESALLQAYCEFVHPYLPLLELHDVLRMINDRSGKSGQMSLLLYQSMMFAGSAFVDMHHFKNKFPSRRIAKKAFFQRARVLYDLDYDQDRVSTVQSLLLMTYWYQGPEDQKDTWHWMGNAISLAHTLGLHRDPANSKMEPAKKKLWKRIWWSCFMRDRLIALAMRRPTRVNESDYDVPMLVEEDFEITVLSEDNRVIPEKCTLMRDTQVQRDLALMCIEKAKLCLCISHILSAQYSVLVRHQGMQSSAGNEQFSLMLIPKKNDQKAEVDSCDAELQDWFDNLPDACKPSEDYTNTNAGITIFVQRSLLHMVYQSAVSALHRPQVLPNPRAGKPPTDASQEGRDRSRIKICEASRVVTKICERITEYKLEKYLPTTGVTVLTPAMIIHLLDIRSPSEEARIAAMEGFCKCMQVLEKLRDNFAAADRATQFLEAALRQTNLEIVMPSYRRQVGSNESQEAEVPNMQQIREAQQTKEAHTQAKNQQLSPPRETETTAEDTQADLPMTDVPVEAKAPNTPDSESNPAPEVPNQSNDLAYANFNAPAQGNFNNQEFFDMNEYVNDNMLGPAVDEGSGFFGNAGWMNGNQNNFQFGDIFMPADGLVNPSALMSGEGMQPEFGYVAGNGLTGLPAHVHGGPDFDFDNVSFVPNSHADFL